MGAEVIVCGPPHLIRTIERLGVAWKLISRRRWKARTPSTLRLQLDVSKGLFPSVDGARVGHQPQGAHERRECIVMHRAP
jgi:hypothetical protein